LHDRSWSLHLPQAGKTGQHGTLRDVSAHLSSNIAEGAAPSPVVAIIGRPNVGKSTLFNRLTGSRRAIVGDEPGITRDRIYGTAEWQGGHFEVVDTGGIIPDDQATIPAAIFQQARQAIEQAQLLLFVVDARQGPTPLDEELAARLRQLGRPVVVVANKAESRRQDADAFEFTRWGFDEVLPVSAEHGQGIGDLLEAIAGRVRLTTQEAPAAREVAVAIVGRPNVGKSSVVNRIIGEERVIVSPIAGTTRDAIDTSLEWQERRFRLIDTAGIRRKGRTELMAEKLSVVMARRHLERADVAVLLIDAVEGPTNLDATIGGYAHEAGCSTIIAVNKWDLVADKKTSTPYEFERRVREQMKYLDYAPVVFISALTGQRLQRLLELAARAADARRQRITTASLNEFFQKHLAQPRATLPGRQQLKVRFITQASVAPPTFVLFTNASRGRLHFSYERYVENRLRDTYGFFATPIRVVGRNKSPRAEGK
jgi:GTP-binding protein